MADRRTEKKTVLSSQAVAAATNTSSMYVGDYTEALVYFDVTAESGTDPTLDPVVQVSHDDSEWFSHTTMTQIAATGNSLVKLTNIGTYLRVNIPAPGGSSTPSMTLSIVIEAKN